MAWFLEIKLWRNVFAKWRMLPVFTALFLTMWFIYLACLKDSTKCPEPDLVLGDEVKTPPPHTPSCCQGLRRPGCEVLTVPHETIS